MSSRLLHRLLPAAPAGAEALRPRLAAATRPPAAPLLTGTLADLARTKPQLVAHNLLLRQQLIILRRQIRRPRCTPAERALLVLLPAACAPGATPCSSSSPTPCCAGIAGSSVGTGVGSLEALHRRTAHPSRPRQSC